jgi:hypothetical protein
MRHMRHAVIKTTYTARTHQTHAHTHTHTHMQHVERYVIRKRHGPCNLFLSLFLPIDARRTDRGQSRWRA